MEYRLNALNPIQCSLSENLRGYLDNDEIQYYLPRDHQEVPTMEILPDNLESSFGAPYSYQDFDAGEFLRDY